MMKLGTRIKSWRDHNNWTLNDLSQQTGLSVGYLSDIERGRTLPSIPTLVKLADAFDFTVVSLLVGVDFGERARNRALTPENTYVPTE